MSANDNSFERGLNSETLQRMSQLSQRKQQTGEKFTVVATMVGPYTDQIKIKHSNGKVGNEFIEDAGTKKS